MLSFTEQLFQALVKAGAVSQTTGLTANQVAEQHDFDKKNTSTVMGNLFRKKLANRSLEQTTPGLRGEYRYWLVKDAVRKARFWKQRRQQPEQVEQSSTETIINGENYVMTITGPHDFAARMTVEPSKLSQVIAAANGG